MERTELASRRTHVRSDAGLDEPAEPIICWLDSGCQSCTQVRQAPWSFALLFTCICVLIAGGFAVAAWNHNRAAESRRGQSSTTNANWETTDTRRLVATLGATHVRAIATQSEARSDNSETPEQTIGCGPAPAQLCPEDSLFRQLPELMTPSENDDTVLSRRQNDSRVPLPRRWSQLREAPVCAAVGMLASLVRCASRSARGGMIEPPARSRPASWTAPQTRGRAWPPLRAAAIRTTRSRRVGNW